MTKKKKRKPPLSANGMLHDYNQFWFSMSGLVDVAKKNKFLATRLRTWLESLTTTNCSLLEYRAGKILAEEMTARGMPIKFKERSP